jgi:1,4-dihydroxy-2-naphthoate octaprenyltransferase
MLLSKAKMRQKIKLYFQETRPRFLLLTVVLIFVGTCLAWYEGYFHLQYALLAFAGLLLLHISVNTLNDYFDYKSGIDLETIKTPFSGGSGILPANLLAPASVARFGFACFLLAIPIGIYFIVLRGWLLLPILVAGALCVMLYTTHLVKWGMGELAAGLGLGTLPVLGAYFVQTGMYSWNGAIAAIPSGILVHNLLLLNEFPDVEADRKGNRKTFPIAMGKNRASLLYATLTLTVYVWVVVWSIKGLMPKLACLAVLTLPFAIKAIRGARNYHDQSKLLPALGANVIVVLATQLLIGMAYMTAKLI